MDCFIVAFAALLHQTFNLVPLLPHIVGCDQASANRAHIVGLEPLDDALRVESVAHVAAERSHLIAIFKVNKADNAVVDAPEPAFIISNARCVLNDSPSCLLSLPVVSPSRDQTGDDARAENDDDDRNTECDESLGQDEAHNDGKHTKTIARIGVVAMWGEAFKSPQHVDGPRCVQNAHDGLQDEDASRHSVFLVCQKRDLVDDAQDGLCQDHAVEEYQIELSRIEFAT